MVGWGTIRPGVALILLCEYNRARKGTPIQEIDP